MLQQHKSDKMDQQPQWMEGLVAALNGRRKPIPAPKFDGTSDIRKFLQTSAEVAEQNQWDEEERTLHLKLALQGTASECVQGDTADEMAQSLLTRFQLSREEARRELRSLKLKPGQDIHKFGNLVMKLVKMADPELEGEQLDDRATAELVDAIGDRFLTREFRLQGPINFADAIRRIQQYNADMKINRIHRLELSDPDEGDLNTKVASLTKENEGLKKTIQQFQKDMSQKLDAIISRETATGGTLNNPARCQNCGRLGHLTKDCWGRQPNRPGRRTITCYSCNQSGHIARMCPNKPAGEREQPAFNSRGPEQ